MDTLFVDRKDTQLDIEGGRLLMRVPDEPRPVSLPIRQLRYIALSARVTFSSSVMLGLAAAGVTLVVIHPRKPDDLVVVNSSGHGAVQRRLLQAQVALSGERCLGLARTLVRAKLVSYYRVARRCLRRRPDLRRPIFKLLKQLRDIHRNLDQASSLNALRGYEGAAASAWFAVYVLLLPPHWEFSGRQRRPPPDPVNAVLSLTYTLLHGEAIRALSSHGLDPAIGTLHEPDYGRNSLACDLQELLRAEVDEWVLKLMKETFRPVHFGKSDEKGCLLNKQGRSIFFPLFQVRARSWRIRCRLLAWRFVEQLEASDGSSMSVC